MLLGAYGCGPNSMIEHLFADLTEDWPHAVLESDGHGGKAGQGEALRSKARGRLLKEGRPFYRSENCCAHFPAPRSIGQGRDFAGLNFAAAAPEDVGVGDRDAGFVKMLVNGRFVGEQ